jgi:hypothetical protein
MEINEIKLEKKLQEIKALLIQLLKHDEYSEPENEIRSIKKLFEFSMKDFFEDQVLYSLSDKYKTRESI